MTIVVSGLREVIASLDKIEHGLSGEQTARLDALFARTFADVEARVHVEEGVLRESGIARTHTDGSTWTGEIEYAHEGIFELARGGEHFFLEPEVAAEADFEALCQRILDELAS